MSPIGRIFLVLNLFLSAAFLGWASNALSSVEDFKGQLESAKSELSETVAAKDAEIADLQTKNNELSESSRRMREERDSVSADRDGKDTQLSELKRENASLQASLSSIESKLGDYNGLIEQMSSDKDRYVELANEAKRERDAAVAEASDAGNSQRDAEERARELETQLGDLQDTVAALQTEVSRQEVALTTYSEVTGVPIDQIQAVPKIDGAVLSVRMDVEPGLVILNQGRDSGVRRGMTFEIYRGGQYKGQVRVVNVEARQSSALVSRLNGGVTLAQGDRATTRL